MAGLVSKEQWYSYLKQREEEARKRHEEWVKEELLKSEIKRIAREEANKAAKEYIESQRREIEIEVDERSIKKAWEEMLKGF